MTRRAGWALLIAANVVFCCVLSFYRASGADPRGGKPPFANPVEQRMEMINQLREIKELLKEQNALLQSGELKVVVSDAKQP